MAQNEIVNVLTIKTEESQRTIKGLKKEIADLKKILDNAVIGSEEFEQASRDLKVAQNELKAAMTGQRQSVDALEGSYDALVQEMAKLKKEWRATADVAKRNEIGQQIEIINNQLKELDATIGNNQRKVGAYAEEIGKVLAKNSNDIDGLAGSVAGNAATFKQALSEQDDATISTRTKLESVQKVTAGLASGYAAVQGTMALLGIENENLEKTFVKLQAAMAIAQGVGGMKDLVEGLSRGKVAFAGATNGVKMFIKGLSGVQKAIIGTGIGALVVAVGLLIANWDKISQMLENINPQKKAAKATRELNTEITKLANQSAGDKIAKVNELSLAYSKLGDNLDAKKQFVIDYKDELANMGIEMNNVNDADEIFVKNTNAYITALMARAKADALRQKATEDYKKGLDIIAEAEKEAIEGGEMVVEGVKGGVFGQLQMLWGAYKVKSATEDFAGARKMMDENFKNLFEQAAKYDAEADKLLKKKKKTGGSTDSSKTDTQNTVLEEIRVSQLTEEEKLYDELERKYEKYLKLFKGDTEKQLLVVQWYTDEYAKLVEKELDERIKADAKIAKSAEETRKRISEADKQRYAEAVAKSEKRLSGNLQGIDAGAETLTYLNERRKPKGNGEINTIDNELSKLETLKNITSETLNLKVAAIEAEQALFEKSSERWIELENQKVTLREQTNRTLGELSEQYYEQEKNRNRALAGSITNTFTATLSSASAIIGALQEGIDTTTKEGFEKNKKMQIANATIQMLVGITSALAGAFTTKSGPWDIALAAIQAATIATTGGIQIAKIKQQTFDGGNSSITPSVSPNVSMDLPVSYTRNLMGNMETEEMNTAQRVYILESDIEESGRRVEIRDNNTNF